MLTYYKTILIIAISAFAIISCECVPGIDTPKKIEPSDYTEFLFVNASDELSSIEVSADDLNIGANLNYEDTKLKYNKVPIGFPQICFYESGFPIYTTFVKSEKQISYNLFIYGKKNKPSVYLIQDSVRDKNTKIVNFIPISGNNIILKIDKSYETEFLDITHSEINLTNSGKTVFKLEDKSGLTLAEKELNIDSNKENIIILKKINTQYFIHHIVVETEK